MEPLKLLADLVAIPGPPGQEDRVRDYIAGKLSDLGHESRVDAKGNLVVGSDSPTIVVTAHLDEIALLVKSVEPDGLLTVAPLGGLHPWKIGEGPVTVMASAGDLNGILSYGSVHTNFPNLVRDQEDEGLEWEGARVFTGLDWEDLAASGVRAGTRVAVHPSRRTLFAVSDFISSYFLDDRADLVSWLLALQELGNDLGDVAFVATASEETGGEGALYYLNSTRPDVCIALELGPNAPDAPVEINEHPTVWAHDSYSTMTPFDGDLVAAAGTAIGLDLQFQALSRGGSDASCAASHGHCARPITLGLPMENSHGFEVIHPESMTNLARLTSELVRRLRD